MREVIKHTQENFKMKEGLVENEFKINVCTKFEQEEYAFPLSNQERLPEEYGTEEYMRGFLCQCDQEIPEIETTKDKNNGTNISAPAYIPPTGLQSDQDEAPRTIETNQLVAIMKSLAESHNQSRLHLPEPGVFKGNLLEYPIWIKSFETLIESRAIRSSERLHFLRK